MADAAQEATESAPKSEKKGALKIILILAIVVGLDGGLIYFAATYLGGGKSGSAQGMVDGEGGGGTPTPPSDLKAEVKICTLRADHSREGATYIYDTEIWGLIPEDAREMVEKRVKANQAQIEDAIRQVVAGAEREELDEPALTYVRDKIRTELARTLREELVEKVLITKWIRIRAR